MAGEVKAAVAAWSAAVRDADGYPVRVGHEGADVFVSVARAAPRGRMRFDAETRDEFMHVFAEAERRAEAAEAAQAAQAEEQ